jgi:hypothetical protein
MFEEHWQQQLKHEFIPHVAICEILELRDPLNSLVWGIVRVGLRGVMTQAPFLIIWLRRE